MTLDILNESGKEVVIRLFKKMATEEPFTQDDLIDLKTKVKVRMVLPKYKQEVDNTTLLIDKQCGKLSPIEHQFFLNFASTPLTTEELTELRADSMKVARGKIPNSVLSRGPMSLVSHLTKFNTLQEAYRLVQYLRTAIALRGQDFVIKPYKGVEQN